MAIIQTREELESLFCYDPLSGSLKWRQRDLSAFADRRAWKSWNERYADREAGAAFTDRHGKSYRKLTLAGKTLLCHRVIFKLVTGVEPVEVDHADGDGFNNAWLNLISCWDHKANHRNKRLPATNTSGLSGVWFDKKRNRYVAEIKFSEKKLYLGRFPDFFSACCARKSAEVSHGFSQFHGHYRPL